MTTATEASKKYNLWPQAPLAFEEEELLPREQPKLFGFRRAALLEIGVFFVIALLIDWLLAGNRFWDMSLHPFFIIVLLVSAQYGSSEGMLAAGVSTAALLLWNLPEQKLDQDWYDYMLDLTYRPVLWFCLALVLGELAQRHIRDRLQLRAALKETEEREQTITGEYRRIQKLNENLELRIASQMRTGLSAYKAAMALETLEPRDVILGISGLVESITHATRFSVFLLHDNKLEAAISHNWSEEDHYKRVFGPETAIYRKVVGHQKLLSVVNENDRADLHHEGLIAGPLVNQDSGEVIGMLKIEDAGFLDLNITSIETFRMLCEWIGTTYAHARRYQQAKEQSILDPDHQLLSPHLLQRQVQFMTGLAQRAGFDVSMLVLRLDNAEELGRENARQAAVALGEAVRSALRKIDQAFQYQQNQWEFAVMLPNTPAENVAVVVDKIFSVLNERVAKAKQKPRFSHEVRAVYQHTKTAR